MNRFQGVWALGVLLLVSFGFAEDWAQWRGPDRSGHVPAGIAVPASLEAAKVVWKIPQGEGLASPVVSGGKVFYLEAQHGKEVVHGADGADGMVLWSYDLDDLHKDSQSPAGPRCTPVVDGDRVYAQSCRGELACLNAADGKPIWRTNYVKDFGAIFIGEKGSAEGARRHGNNGSPIVDGEHLIAMVGGPGAGVVCFEKKTGKVVWKAGDDIPAYAAPILTEIGGKRQLVAFTVPGVMALDPADGKLLWHTPVKTQLGRHVTTPVVFEEMVVVSSHQAGLIGVKVTREGEAFKAERVWTNKDLAINFSSPVNVGQYLYGVGPRRNLICVDIRSGKLMWEKEGYFAGGGGSAHAGFIVMEKNILMLSDAGELVLIEADAARCKEIGRKQVAGKNWCNPAYAMGSVFLRDGNSLERVGVAP